MTNTARPAVPPADSRSLAICFNASAGRSGASAITRSPAGTGGLRSSIWMLATFSRSGVR